MLGEPGHNSLNHGKAQVAGWGKTQNKTADKSTYIVATPKLQKLEVPVLSIQNCLQKIKDVGFDASEDLRYISTLKVPCLLDLKEPLILFYEQSETKFEGTENIS